MVDVLLFSIHCFGSTRIHCIWPDPGKEIEVDPDPKRGLKWIRIRPNAVDPAGSGSGSETLLEKEKNGTLKDPFYGG